MSRVRKRNVEVRLYMMWDYALVLCYRVPEDSWKMKTQLYPDAGGDIWITHSEITLCCKKIRNLSITWIPPPGD